MSKFTTHGAYEELREKLYAYTSLSRVRQIAKEYSGKYKVPIRISRKAFRETDTTDAYLVGDAPNFVIYLHPIVQYYKESDIRDSIEHELEHLQLERKRYKITRKGVEYMVGRPKS